jgi:hypothetical protein
VQPELLRLLVCAQIVNMARKFFGNKAEFRQNLSFAPVWQALNVMPKYSERPDSLGMRALAATDSAHKPSKSTTGWQARLVQPEKDGLVVGCNSQMRHCLARRIRLVSGQGASPDCRIFDAASFVRHPRRLTDEARLAAPSCN